MIGKLLGVATVGNTLAGVVLVRHFLSGITKIIILVIVSSFMLCALLASVFIVSYFSLVHCGLDPYVAGIALGIIAFFLTAMFLAITVDQIQKLRELPYLCLGNFRNDLPNMRHIASAFIEGFLSPKKKKV